ncbi:hypothetical protein ACIPZF_11405 [Pseudomonas sp. NPDC089752]|uniref:hypothetical protein n=1 Tax=Pseudomonas sp. NPDC089752 TaxID=3364472 RepID=UPI0037F187C7
MLHSSRLQDEFEIVQGDRTIVSDIGTPTAHPVTLRARPESGLGTIGLRFTLVSSTETSSHVVLPHASQNMDNGEVSWEVTLKEMEAGYFVIQNSLFSDFVAFDYVAYNSCLSDYLQFWYGLTKLKFDVNNVVLEQGYISLHTADRRFVGVGISFLGAPDDTVMSPTSPYYIEGWPAETTWNLTYNRDVREVHLTIQFTMKRTGISAPGPTITLKQR